MSEKIIAYAGGERYSFAACVGDMAYERVTEAVYEVIDIDNIDGVVIVAIPEPAALSHTRYIAYHIFAAAWEVLD